MLDDIDNMDMGVDLSATIAGLDLLAAASASSKMKRPACNLEEESVDSFGTALKGNGNVLRPDPEPDEDAEESQAPVQPPAETPGTESAGSGGPLND